jgi:hypothetical protein
MRELPQPLKTLYLLWIACFLATVILLPAHHAGWGLGPLGVVAILTGLTLVSDYRGGATAMAQAMRARPPRGFTFTYPYLANRPYARVFGGLAVVAGAGLVVGALTFH